MSAADIGNQIKAVLGVAPAANAAGTVNGTGFDRRGFDSCKLSAISGAATGSPTSFTLDVKIQHSDAQGSGFVDWVPGAAGSGAVATISAASDVNSKAISLKGAKPYIRAVAVTAFVGGSTPTLNSAAMFVLGGADIQPAQADD